jgi:hypothetical protein
LSGVIRYTRTDPGIGRITGRPGRWPGLPQSGDDVTNPDVRR